MVVRVETERNMLLGKEVDVGIEGVCLRVFEESTTALGTVSVNNGDSYYTFVVREAPGGDEDLTNKRVRSNSGNKRVRSNSGKPQAGLVVEYHWLCDVYGPDPRENVGYAYNACFPEWVLKKLRELYEALAKEDQSLKKDKPVLEKNKPGDSRSAEQQANQNKQIADKGSSQVITSESVEELCRYIVLLARKISNDCK